MKRRSFIHTSLAAMTTTAAGTALAEGANPEKRELYELLTYLLHAGKQPILDGYLSKAFIPATKRLGIGPVGVFVEKGEKDQLKVLVLLVHPSAESVAGLSSRLAADTEYRKAAREYLAASAADPVYSRIDSSLHASIEGMAKLVKPDVSKPRLLNLRIYESHNERAGKKKIEMFNKGELAIFRRVGLTPVFFAETIVGAAMPNLTYLLVFPDKAGLAAAWNRFRVDADWLKLKAIPEYADKEIVSRITNRVMTPTSYSEI
jgi:hypothetical protein